MRRFESKIDAWLAYVIYGAALICLFTSIYVVYTSPGIGSYLLSVVIFCGGFLFPLWLVRSTAYLVGTSTLVIKSGPFRWLIELDDIVDIEASSNPISSPALSLDRLAIRYGNGKHV